MDGCMSIYQSFPTLNTSKITYCTTTKYVIIRKYFYINSAVLVWTSGQISFIAYFFVDCVHELILWLISQNGQFIISDDECHTCINNKTFLS